MSIDLDKLEELAENAKDRPRPNMGGREDHLQMAIEEWKARQELNNYLGPWRVLELIAEVRRLRDRVGEV